ncbi:type 1 fimbrial protein [Proteus sp. G2661]|uniref:fimbrial protein n=1 Tax=Proteus sp. G2661 TaxID=2698874 RepID=UPI001376CA4D|nr:type 1 fimbrial protein [Proteus sp. G2661]
MKKKLAAILTLLMLTNTAKSLSNHTIAWGKVSMHGSIVETACAIEMDNREQTVDMQAIPISLLARNGKGIAYSFKIKLINCTQERLNPRLSPWQAFSVTFDGIPDGQLLQVEGTAKGAGLQIIDEWGNIAELGRPMPLVKQISQELNYTINLLLNNSPLQAGAFRSVARFKMDYY